MDMTLAYRGRSSIIRRATGMAISLAPNLRRDRVSFCGTLRQPLRFREAISAVARHCDQRPPLQAAR